MRIELRSDTFTKPTKEMLDYMFNAEVGDDVWEEDYTAKALEEKVASMFGMEAALFCPSGTMANQIAIKVHTQAGDEVICDYSSHVYQYEGGGTRKNAHLSKSPKSMKTYNEDTTPGNSGRNSGRGSIRE